jgi:hypothetical protein
MTFSVNITATTILMVQLVKGNIAGRAEFDLPPRRHK